MAKMKTKQIVIILNTVEAGEEYLSHTAGRDEEWYSHLENSSVFSFKTKYTCSK